MHKSGTRACLAGPGADPSCLYHGPAPAQVLTLPVPCHPYHLSRWHCQHLPAPMGPSTQPAPSRPACSTPSRSPTPHWGRQSQETWGLKPQQQLVRRQSQHSHGTCLGPAHKAAPGRKLWLCSHGLGQVPSSEPAAELAHWRFGPRLGYCANPPMQVFIAPLPTSHKKGLLLTSLLPARGAPPGWEGDRRQVEGMGQRTHSMGGSQRG